MKTKMMAAAVLAMLAVPANAAVTYDIKNGKVMAVRGIYGNPMGASTAAGEFNRWTYQGKTWETFTDIEFIDGPCADIFQACPGDHFSAAARKLPSYVNFALSVPVVIDGIARDLRKDASFINGCSDADCDIYAGLQFDSEYLRMIGVTNQGLAFGPDDSPDTSKLSGATYARFTTYSIAVAVPEPTTWAMMLVGFGMVGAATRYRRRTTAAAMA